MLQWAVVPLPTAVRVKGARAYAERSLQTEAARVRVAQQQCDEVRAQEALRAGEGAVHGLPVWQGGVDLLAYLCDLEQLVVLCLQSQQVVLQRSPVVALRLAHRRERAEQSVQLSHTPALHLGGSLAQLAARLLDATAQRVEDQELLEGEQHDVGGAQPQTYPGEIGRAHV